MTIRFHEPVARADRLKVSESLRSAVRSLRTNALRSVLTATGIVIGVAAVTCVLAIGAGARADVGNRLRTLGANLLLVFPGAEASRGARVEPAPLTEEDVSAIRLQVHGVALAAPLVSGQLPLVAGDRNWRTLVAGSDNAYLAAREWSLRLGRVFSDEEIRTAAKVAIIGSVVSRSLFGGGPAVGSSFRIGHIPFTVVGVLDDKGLGSAGRSQDDVIFIPIATAESRILGALHGVTRTALDFITIKVSDPASLTEVKGSIEDLLRKRHRLRPGAPSDFRFSDPSELLAARAASVRSLNLLLLAVACISLVVGGISVLNVMILSVTERTREIGLRMAVGARRGDIRSQFLIEAVVLALAGGLLGSLIGSAAAIAVGLSAGWPILLKPISILLAWGIAAATGIVFGLYPAQRASALDPMTALRSE